MRKFFSQIHADSLGFSASMVCAVHCGLLPFVLTLTSLSSLSWLAHPWMDVSFIGASMVIAMFALGRNFVRHRHIRLALGIISAGFALIIIAHFVHGYPGYVVAVFGGITVAAGHIVNWRLAQRSACCRSGH